MDVNNHVKGQPEYWFLIDAGRAHDTRAIDFAWLMLAVPVSPDHEA